MSTHIINFDEKTWEAPDGERYYQCREIPWWSTTGTTISRLTPYNEDNAYAHGYTEAEAKYRQIRDKLEKDAYRRGYEDAKHECEDCTKNVDLDAIRKEAYRKGLHDCLDCTECDRVNESYQQGAEDMREAVNKICCMSWAEQKEVFGTDSLIYIIARPASEIIERLRQYEQEQEYDNSIRNAVMDFMSKTGYNADQIMEAAEALQKKKEGEENDLV